MSISSKLGVAVLGASLLLAGCSGDDGKAGATGATGAAGAAGATGATGAPGQDATDTSIALTVLGSFASGLFDEA